MDGLRFDPTLTMLLGWMLLLTYAHPHFRMSHMLPPHRSMSSTGSS